MKKWSYELMIGVTLLICAACFASGDIAQSISEEEVSALKDFFKDFKDAFNSKDVDRVRILSGNTWSYWKKTINEGMVGSIEILDICIDTETNVVTKCVAIDCNKRSYPAEVVFTMKKESGNYSIDKIAFPIIEKQNEEIKEAKETVVKLITAINSSDLSTVKSLVSFGDAEDFANELESRGLRWITDAIDGRNVISKDGVGVSRNGKGVLIGRLHVPNADGSANILRNVVVKDGKIDRAAPRGKSPEERRRRAEENLKDRLREMEEGRLERPASQQ